MSLKKLKVMVRYRTLRLIISIKTYSSDILNLQYIVYKLKLLMVLIFVFNIFLEVLYDLYDYFN